MEVAEPEIEIDRIGAEDHSQALGGMRDRGGRRRRRAIHHRRIGCPPAHASQVRS